MSNEQPQVSTEGQFFTLQPVPPPKPKANTHWSLPLALGLLAIPLLMLGFGFAQQQQPVPTPSATASVELSPTPDPTPQPTAMTAQTPAAQPSESTTSVSFDVPSDSAMLPIARVHCPGRAANFRAAPSLHSQILSVLQNGDLVELTTEQRVQQDGVTWLPVRFRGQIGWLASNFIDHRRDYASQP